MENHSIFSRIFTTLNVTYKTIMRGILLNSTCSKYLKIYAQLRKLYQGNM